MGIFKSIIITNYNGQTELDRCLRSLQQHTDPNDTEIIVVDNASTDGSLEYVQKNFPGVIMLQNSGNYGFGYANNVGACQATGQYLAFLNPDTEVTAGCLEKLIAALEANPEVGMVTPKVLLQSDPERINACGHQVHLTGIVQCRGMGAPKEAFASQEEVAAVSGAAFVIRCELFRRLQGFDAPFFLYIEDTDLSWRTWLAGYRCLYIPEAIVYHDYRLCFPSRKLYYYERNRYLLLLKNLRWATLLVLTPVLLLAELIAWGFVFLYNRTRWVNKVHAYKWIVSHWKDILADRKRNQALRKVGDRDLLRHLTFRLACNQVGTGLLPRLAQVIFDPLFFMYKILTQLLVWW
jgi:GT2 family glycosyltransferase